MTEDCVIYQTPTRYYRISLFEDLFGVWLVVRQWGGLGKKGYREKVSSHNTYDDALAVFKNAKRRRLARGYEQVLF